ncbi:MAG: hypothetical protein GY847_04390 [Proteobacteria bacterium]|nr:hypothetical protein [Pseudomonadota bacterium]
MMWCGWFPSAENHRAGRDRIEAGGSHLRETVRPGGRSDERERYHVEERLTCERFQVVSGDSLHVADRDRCHHRLKML